jgi:hypothetical protein
LQASSKAAKCQRSGHLIIRRRAYIDDKIPATKDKQDSHYAQTLAKWEEARKDVVTKQKAIIDPVREKALIYHKERYLTDSRASIFKPQSEWTALDRWINHRVAYVTTDDDLAYYFQFTRDDTNYKKENFAKWDEYKKLGEELKTFDKLKPAEGPNTITSLTELDHPDAPPIYIFSGGNHEKPLDEVQPAFPSALTDEKPAITPTATSSGRRTALANWLASPQNPLTARVFVNRVWNEYFGKGIVSTVSDFGKAGDKPSNPELLDYLANNFVK